MAKRGFLRAAPIAAALCAAVLLFIYLRAVSRATDPYLPLIDAASTWTHRRAETRLAIDFVYKPLSRSTHPTDNGRHACQSLLPAAAATANRSDVPSSRAFATMQLYCGDHDAAASSFEKLLLSETRTMTTRAALRASTDIQLVANAAAAFYEDAVQGDRHERFSLALAATERALHLDGNHLSALFTRALTFKWLGLEEDARITWRHYLRVDNGTPWAREASAHLASKRIAPRARNIEDIISRDLGMEWARSRDEARLEVLEITASTIADQTGDTLARDSVAFVRRNPTISVASALATYAAGVFAYKERQISDAEDQLDKAIAVFTKMQCPVVYSALVQKSACRFYENDIAGALAIAKRVIRSAPNSYRSVRGKALWLEGLCQIVLGRSRESLRSYHAAIAEFRALRDTDSTAAINTLLAELYQYMGDRDNALFHRRAALGDAYASGNPFRLSMALSEAGAASIDAGEIEIAAATFRRLLTVAQSSNDSLAVVDALMSYGRLLGRTKETAAAAQAFDEAHKFASQQKEVGIRTQLEAMITLRAAEAGVVENTKVDDLDEAIDVFSKAGNRYALVSSLLARGKLAALRGTPEAERDFRRALDLIHAELDTLKDPIRRATFLEERQAIYDALVHNLVARDPLKAFQAADDAHHALLETYVASKRPAGLVDPHDIPRDTALVEYFVSDDNIFSWLVVDGSVTSFRVAAEGNDVLQLVEQAVTAISEERYSRARTLLRRLDELLMQPWVERIGSRSSLVIVPDGFLAGIPFAALVGPDGRYRIEQFSLSTAVSMRHHVDNNARWEFGADHVGIIAIGSRFANLSSLPEVQSELTALRSLYPRAEVETHAVQPGDVIALIGRNTVAHIATHGYRDMRRPLSSGIVLQRGMSVTAADVATSRFRETQLVFLGACESGAAATPRMAVGNLATAFLAAGVPNVVGILWNVDDRDARVMAEAFHAELRDGKGPRQALRSAQLNYIRRRNSGFGWAAYIVIGGKTS